MQSKPPVIYWDTCVFLAWIKNEKRPHGEMDGLASVLNEVEKGNLHLLTSVTTRAEILFKRSGENAAAKFNDLFKRSNVHAVNIDEHIATEAAEIREYYIEQPGKGLGFADAIHLATALTYNASVFHTFDDGKKGQLGLLELNGDVAGRPLSIEKPRTKQGVLDLSGGKIDNAEENRQESQPS